MRDIVLPARDARAPCEPTAERFHQYDVPRMNAAISDRFVERKRDRSRRGVGVALDCQHRFLRVEAELAADGFDNSRVRLMWHEPVDVGGAEPIGGECLVDDGA